MSTAVRWFVLLSLMLGLYCQAARAEDRALIVGVNSYPHFPSKQLTGAVNDARAIERLAREVWGFKPEQIKVLLDAEATSVNILSSMDDWLIAGSQPGDRILFYYSGHGYYTFQAGLPSEEAWRETIAPHDVRPTGVAGVVDNMIVDTEIRQRLDALKGRTVLFIADACHSGTLWRSLAGAGPERPSIVRSLAHDSMPQPISRSMRATDFDKQRARRLMPKPAGHIIAWSAVHPTELAEEDMELAAPDRHGVFTRRFIQGLRDERADRNGDGRVSVMELYGFVSEQTGAYCGERYCRSGRMTPMMEAPGHLIGLDLLSWRPRGDQFTPGTLVPAASGDESKKTRPAPTHVLPASNVAGLKLDLLPNAQSRVGQETKIRLSSPRPGWLIVLDVRDDGRVVQLFPSRCAIPDRAVRAGTTITLPDARYGCAFTAAEAGSGQIVAIVAEDNVPLDGLLSRHRDLSVVPDPEAYLAELARNLMQAWYGDERTRPTRWSLVTARYKIDP